MTSHPTPLFWSLTSADFTRAIKRSRNETNAVAAQIREKLSSLAGQPCRVRPLGVAAVHGAEAVPLLLGTKYLNTLIHAKPAAQSGDSARNSADTPDRGRLGGNFYA